MPLLHAEPSIYPESLLEADVPDQQWWALYTMSRQEKELCRHLLAREIAFYCPTIPRRYRSPGGRARTSYLPLFSNYVFLRGTDEQRQVALSTACVSRSIPVVDAQRFVAELKQLADLISRGAPLTPESQLSPGTRVRVKSGPLRDIVGTVTQRRGEKRLLVMVNFIQRGASVELGDWELERFE